jgi:hypothetical protein
VARVAREEVAVEADERKLRIASVLHLGLGAFACLFACLPLLYVVIGAAIMVVPPSASHGGGPPPWWFGGAMMVVGLLFAGVGWATGLAILRAGWSMDGRTRHRYCMIVSAVESMFFPFGTILGVFTLFLLRRTEVRKLFGEPLLEPGSPKARLEDLGILGTLHQVMGLLVCAMGTMPLVHVALGLAIALAPAGFPEGKAGPPPAIVGWMFAGMGAAAILLAEAMGGAMIAAGRSLAARRHHGLCSVLAGLECLAVPFGTVLGVLTLVALQQPDVREAFEAPAATA